MSSGTAVRLGASALVCVCVLALASSAGAQEPSAGSVPPTIGVPSTLPRTPEAFQIGAEAAIAEANRDPLVQEARERYGSLSVIPTTKSLDWEVAYATNGTRVVLVIVDGVSGSVREAWTGAAVIWPMARGKQGQFGHVLNAPWVWLPLSAIFLLGLVDLRRMRRIVHLDLLVLLSFGISHVFFNDAEIGVSVPLVYPPLLYLLGRMLWIGFRGPGGGLRPSAPIGLLALATVALICFRIAINVGDSGVIDVGYAGVIGADRVLSGEPIYGANSFPTDNPTGDTYGPANYYAYVPFELAFGWSGAWDSLPAGRAASIFFDLAALAGLFVLGRRLIAGAGGTRLGIVLAFAWAAFPYTAFALQSNSNDALVGALVVWALVAIASPMGRGALLAVASAVKFAPLALVPVFATGERGLVDRMEGVFASRDRDRDHETNRLRSTLSNLRPVIYFAGVFIATAALLLLHPAVDPGLVTFFDRTVATQIGRTSPFSIWGQVSWLGPVQAVVGVGAAALAASFAFIPRKRAPVQIAALGAAALIAAQLAIEHWFYLYIPWFFGLLIAALAFHAMAGREGDDGSESDGVAAVAFVGGVDGRARHDVT